MLNPKALEAFRSIIVTGSTTAAAETMRVSQPGVSRLLKSLEAALGYVLFVRVGGRLSPTPEGLALFEEVERYFGGLEQLERAARQIKGRRGRSYRVAVMPALGLRFLPYLISRLGAPSGLPTFALSVVRSETVAGLVLSRQCDLGIVSGVIDVAGMQVLARYAVDCLCILPPGHPLAVRERIAWRDFAGYPLVALNSTTITGVRIAAALKAAQAHPLVTAETHHSAVVSSAVLSGSGIAAVDAFTAQDHVARGGVARPMVAPVQFDFNVVKPAGLGSAEIQQRLLDTLATEIAAVVDWASAPRRRGA